MIKKTTKSKSVLSQHSRLFKITSATLVFLGLLVGVLYLVGLNVQKAEVNLVGSRLGGGTGTKGSDNLVSGGAKATLKEAVEIRSSSNAAPKNTPADNGCTGKGCVDEVETREARKAGSLAIQNKGLVDKDNNNIAPTRTSLANVDRAGQDEVVPNNDNKFVDVVVKGGQAVVGGLLGGVISSQIEQEGAKGGAVGTSSRLTESSNTTGNAPCTGKGCVDEDKTKEADLAIENKNFISDDGTNLVGRQKSLSEISGSDNKGSAPISPRSTNGSSTNPDILCKTGNVTVAAGTWVATGKNMGEGKESQRQCVQVGENCNHGAVMSCSDAYKINPLAVVLPVNAGAEYSQGLAANDPSVDKTLKVKANCYNGVEVVPSGNTREDKGVCEDGIWVAESTYNALLLKEFKDSLIGSGFGNNSGCIPGKNLSNGIEVWVTCSGREVVSTQRCREGSFDEQGNCISKISGYSPAGEVARSGRTPEDDVARTADDDVVPAQNPPLSTFIQVGGGALVGCGAGTLVAGPLFGCIPGAIIGGYGGNVIGNAAGEVARGN